MIDTNLRKAYQKHCIDPLLRKPLIKKIDPMLITTLATLTGICIYPLLAFHYSLVAFVFLFISGFFDSVDGSQARERGKTSAKGAAFDITSDRIVEFAVILGLFAVDPETRGLPALLMLGSVLICVTSFLIVGIFTPNRSDRSFHYSPGLMERTEAFIFFGLMILLPSTFSFLAYFFSILVMLTALIRMLQFIRVEQKITE